MDPRAGGPCQGIRNLAPHIVQHGHTIEVVCLDNPGSDYLKSETLNINVVGKRIGSWGYNPALSSWLKKNLRRYDAVILNGLWQYPGYALSQLAQLPNMPPYFVFPHGMLDPWFQRAPERRLKAIRNWFYWKLIEQHVIRNAAAVLFTCAEEMRLAQDTFHPYQPKKQINVGYGISKPPEYDLRMAHSFAQKNPGLNGRPYFLFLSRIHPKKGVDILIKAYASVYHAPGSPLHCPPPRLVIAGPGLETAYGQQMQKLAADLCPPASVFWPGMLNGDAKWGAFYGAEAFVLPSHQENFGIAVAESLACGKAVLISNQINICKEIELDKAGLVSEDTLAGAEYLFRRWENMLPDDKASMRLAAKASYDSRFGIKITADLLVSIINGYKLR